MVQNVRDQCETFWGIAAFCVVKPGKVFHKPVEGSHKGDQEFWTSVGISEKPRNGIRAKPSQRCHR